MILMIAKETGWTMKHIMRTPIRVLNQLEHAILYSKGVNCIEARPEGGHEMMEALR